MSETNKALEARVGLAFLVGPLVSLLPAWYVFVTYTGGWAIIGATAAWLFFGFLFGVFIATAAYATADQK